MSLALRPAHPPSLASNSTHLLSLFLLALFSEPLTLLPPSSLELSSAPLAFLSQAGSNLEWAYLQVPFRVADPHHPQFPHAYLRPLSFPASLPSSCPTLPVVARVSFLKCAKHVTLYYTLAQVNKALCDLAWPRPSIPARHCFSRFIKNTRLCLGKAMPTLCPWAPYPLTLSSLP